MTDRIRPDPAPAQAPAQAPGPDGGEAPRNRLAHSSSPYLRQHATNPVDWYEWGPEALERARELDRPILLSVGYSACHWCHVMAHESFDDPEIAGSMNENFINIKVDREERPDIDTIYQKVVQAMGQGGGWPLTVFLTPDREPFYGGTYFPPRSMYGRPGFSQVLRALADVYANKREDVGKQAASFMHALRSIGSMLDDERAQAPGDSALSDPRVLQQVTRVLLQRFDDTWGGLGREPKFPNPTILEILARVARSDAEVAREAATALRLTLTKMAQGGIYDHLRGGFARYSVDRVWLVPHFEKMLYDNAQLLPLYAESSVLWPEETRYRRVVRESVAYLEADMRSPQGTFYAATDADSEGVEGKYFCWTPTEVQDLLGDRELTRLFCSVYGVTESGNFEHGWSILHLSESLAERAAVMGMTEDELEARLEPAKRALLQHRYRRVPPHRDEKCLTSWNALLVSGLTRTAMAMERLGDQVLADQAERLALAALERLVDAHVQGVFDGDPARGEVSRSDFEGKVHIRGYLDDVAFLARACLDVHERTAEELWLERSTALAEHALAHHLTERGDGFYFTASDAERLIERTESQHDGPIPSGVGVMLEVLLRLDGAERAPEGARTVVDAVLERYRGAAAQPFAYSSVLTAALYGSEVATHVTVHGPARDPNVQSLASQATSTRLDLFAPVSVSARPDDKPFAVVCRGRTCTTPLREPQAVADELRASR